MNEEKLIKILNKIKGIKMSPSEKLLIKNNLESFLKSIPKTTTFLSPASPLKSPYFWNSKFLAKSLILGALILAVGAGGLSFAAEKTLPGDLLYPIKIKVNEKLKEVTLRTPDAKSAWQDEKIQRRLDEYEKITKKSASGQKNKALKIAQNSLNKEIRQFELEVNTNLNKIVKDLEKELDQTFEEIEQEIENEGQIREEIKIDQEEEEGEESDDQAREEKDKEDEFDQEKFNSQNKLIISFISHGSGINHQAQKEINNFLNRLEGFSNRTSKTEIPWGREGEIDYCFNLENLSAQKRQKFIKQIKDYARDFDLVLVKEEPNCRTNRFR